jgi:hypothetical protein
MELRVARRLNAGGIGGGAWGSDNALGIEGEEAILTLNKINGITA